MFGASSFLDPNVDSTWFSRNNLEMVKAVTLAFSSIQ